MSDVDITSDLTDGSDGALGDRPYNGQTDNSVMQAPPGTQPVHGDAKQVNKVDAPAEKPAQELTLRDQLSNAFKGKQGEPTAQAEAQSAQAPKPAETLALTKDSDGKYRMPDGTFASTEQVQAFESAGKAAPEASQQQSPVIAGLTAQEAQQFQSLPAELRQYVERTMEGLNTRAARYAEYDQLEQLIGPRREAFASQGSTPLVALNQLFALSDFAGNKPGEFVLWFADQHKLDLDALQDARDAANAGATPEMQELRGQVQQLSGQLQQFQSTGQQAAHQANLDAVQNFAAAKDASGVLARPYLTDVMDGWATQITAVRAANPNMPNSEVLQKAYDNACWADPAVRGKMQQAASEASRTSEAARTAAAKSAGSSISGGPVGEASTLPNNSNRSLREELESQFAAARAV